MNIGSWLDLYCNESFKVARCCLRQMLSAGQSVTCPARARYPDVHDDHAHRTSADLSKVISRHKYIHQILRE